MFRYSKLHEGNNLQHSGLEANHDTLCASFENKILIQHDLFKNPFINVLLESGSL